MNAITVDMAERAGMRLGWEAAAVLAVAEVESRGSGYLPDGRPAILFEAHIFSQRTGRRHDAAHPSISSRTWNRALYRGGAAEYDRLNEAIALDADAAFQSASWGAFQIMGFNHRACGFADVTDFVNAMKGGIENHLTAFCTFIAANPAMLRAGAARDWVSFARAYNGPGAVASYSAKIADAYARHAGVGRLGLLDEGPPLPVADPATRGRTAFSSRTVIAGGVAGVSTLAGLADQASTVSQLAGSAASAGYSLSALLRAFGPMILLGLIALGAIGYIVWRYIRKMRAGDVVSR